MAYVWSFIQTPHMIRSVEVCALRVLKTVINNSIIQLFCFVLCIATPSDRYTYFEYKRLKTKDICRSVNFPISDEQLPRCAFNNNDDDEPYGMVNLKSIFTLQPFTLHYSIEAHSNLPLLSSLAYSYLPLLKSLTIRCWDLCSRWLKCVLFFSFWTCNKINCLVQNINDDQTPRQDTTCSVSLFHFQTKN